MCFYLFVFCFGGVFLMGGELPDLCEKLWPFRYFHLFSLWKSSAVKPPEEGCCTATRALLKSRELTTRASATTSFNHMQQCIPWLRTYLMIWVNTDGPFYISLAFLMDTSIKFLNIWVYIVININFKVEELYLTSLNSLKEKSWKIF